MDRNVNPPMEKIRFNHLFGYLARINPKYDKIKVDLTGKLPLRYIDVMNTVFILYNWISNNILSNPITYAKDETIVKAFKENIAYLNKRGLKPNYIYLTMWSQHQYKLTLKPIILASNWWNHTTI